MRLWELLVYKKQSPFLPITVNNLIAGLKIGNLNTYFRFTVLQTVVFHTPIFIPVINTETEHTAGTYRLKEK